MMTIPLSLVVELIANCDFYFFMFIVLWLLVHNFINENESISPQYITLVYKKDAQKKKMFLD